MECKDPKCPVHGSLKTRGARLSGLVVSDKGKKSAIIEVNYTIYTHKYERYLRKRSRIPAYNPECINAKSGTWSTSPRLGGSARRSRSSSRT